MYEDNNFLNKNIDFITYIYSTENYKPEENRIRFCNTTTTTNNQIEIPKDETIIVRL